MGNFNCESAKRQLTRELLEKVEWENDQRECGGGMNSQFVKQTLGTLIVMLLAMVVAAILFVVQCGIATINYVEHLLK